MALIDAAGHSTVVGAGSAYFLDTPGAPEVCMVKAALTYTDVSVYRIDVDGGSFDLGTWTGAGGDAYSVAATAGVLSSTQVGGSPY